MSLARKIIAAAVCVCCLFAFSSCEKETQEKKYVPYDYDLASYISIESVLKMKYTPISTEVTEEETEYRITQMIRSAGLYETDFADLVVASPEGEAILGDSITFHCSATVDGQAYAPAFAENKKITLGEGKVLVDGFEESVIGMKKDETKTVTLKLPSDYSEFKLRNKEIVFSITLKSIDTRYLCPETLTEAQLERVGDYADFTELYLAARDALVEEKEEYARERKIADCFAAAVESATIIAYPQIELELYIADYFDYMDSQAKEMGYADINEYMSKKGVTKEELTAQGMEFARGDILQEMLIYSVARAEGFDKMSDEMFDKFAMPYVKEYDLSSVDQLIEVVGFYNVQKKVLTDVVKQYIADNAVAEIIEEPLE